MWFNVEVNLYNYNPRNDGKVFYTANADNLASALYTKFNSTYLISTYQISTLAPITNTGLIRLKLDTAAALDCQYMCFTFMDFDAHNRQYQAYFFYEVLDVNPDESNEYFLFNLRLDYWHTYMNRATVKLINISACSSNISAADNVPFYAPDVKATISYDTDRAIIALSNETRASFSIIAKISYTARETRDNTASSIEVFAFNLGTYTNENPAATFTSQTLENMLAYIGNIFCTNVGTGANDYKEHKAQCVELFLIPTPISLGSSATENTYIVFKSFGASSNNEIYLHGWKLKPRLLISNPIRALGRENRFAERYLKLGSFQIKLPRKLTAETYAIEFYFSSNSFSAKLKIGEDIEEDITNCFGCQIITAENHTQLEKIANGINTGGAIVSAIAGIAGGAAIGNFGAIVSSSLGAVNALGQTVLNNTPQRAPVAASGSPNGESLLIPDTIDGVDNYALFKIVIYNNATIKKQCNDYIRHFGAACDFIGNYNLTSFESFTDFNAFYRAFNGAAYKLYDTSFLPTQWRELAVKAEIYITNINTNAGAQIQNDFNNGVYIVDITNG